MWQRTECWILECDWCHEPLRYDEVAMHFTTQDEADPTDSEWFTYPDGRSLCADCRGNYPCPEHLWKNGECQLCGEEQINLGEADE